MYKFLVIKSNRAITGFDDESKAKEFAKHHNARVVRNNIDCEGYEG